MPCGQRKREGASKRNEALLLKVIAHTPEHVFTPSSPVSPAAVVTVGSSFLGSACFHGPPECAHKLYRHDGGLELPSGVIRLHGGFEVA